jgi:GT2 family glycosyltransferase
MAAQVTSVGCVLLSQGNRPAELRRAVESVLNQRDVEVHCVVVGNGWAPVDLPSGAEAVPLSENVGIPEGRNLGAAAVRGDLLLFLDDDAAFPDADTFAAVVAQFDADTRLAALQPRAVDPTGRPTAGRHVPRLRGAGLERSGDVAWFWEGCSFLRRTAFEAVGTWPGQFFYGHEGIELAWRLVDRGDRIRYAADLTVLNPEAAPFRGPDHRRLDARNRVWVARRNLPAVLVPVYVGVWSALTLVRVRSRSALSAAVRGTWDGISQPAGERDPIRWRTAWRLTRLGRPPII